MEKSGFINKNYFRNLTYLFIVIGLLYSIFVVGLFYIGERYYVHKMLRENGAAFLINSADEFNSFFSKNRSLLFALENSKLLDDYISSGNSSSVQNLKALFMTVVGHDQNISQLRLIDSGGQELLRVDRSTPRSAPFIVQDSELQNKFSRYYFQETMSSSRGRLYISDLDLNIERGEVEIPYKPMVRFGLPVYRNRVAIGALIVNYFTETLLNEVTFSGNFWVYLLDEKYRLVYTNHPGEKKWRNVFDSESRFNVGRLEQTVPLEHGMMLGIRNKSVHMRVEDLITSIGLVGVISVIMSIIMSYLMSRLPMRLFSKIDMQHRIILQQARNESKSELLSSIAHRWRQPLNEISLSAQMMEQMCKGEDFGGLTLDNVYEGLTDRVRFLSKTIDMFTQGSNASEKSDFRVIYEIKEVVGNVKALLVYHSIKVTINCACEKKTLQCDMLEFEKFCDFGQDIINGYKEDFKQVVFGLIMNAKDAVIESKGHGNEIFINVGVTTDEFTITVSNSGRKIPENIMPHIFEPYFTTKAEGKGTGIGLYVAKNIVEDKFNGEIFAKNSETGVDFVVKLPRS